MSYEPRHWVIGITGASGMRYALRLLDVLSREEAVRLHVVVSEAGLRVLQEEENVRCSVSAISSEALLGEHRKEIAFYSPRDIGALIASGSFRFDGMVIVPCSMGTLGAVASGLATNLVHRAADVTLKEGRKLILVPRETPLTSMHLKNMYDLSLLGVRIIPAMPGFYHRPQTLEALIDMMVMKILDSMGIDNNLTRRWKENE